MATNVDITKQRKSPRKNCTKLKFEPMKHSLKNRAHSRKSPRKNCTKLKFEPMKHSLTNKAIGVIDILDFTSSA